MVCNSATKDSKKSCEVWLLDRIGTNQLKSYIWNSNESSSNSHELLEDTIELKKGEDHRIDLFNNEALFIKKGVLTDFVYVTSDGVSHAFSLDYGYYRSFQRSGAEGGQLGGAYIFRAKKQYLMQYAEIPSLVYVRKGRQVIEVVIKRALLIATTLRFYNTKGSDENGRVDTLVSSQAIEIETSLGTIPVDDDIDKEVILVIADTGIHNNEVFYTNSNGLETQRRIRSSKVNVKASVAGNYYPVNSAIYIEKSKGERVTLMNDRSQGGSSIQDGSIELMIHRRVLEDDSRGVQEALNDDRPVRVKHWLFFSNSSVKQRSLQYDLDTQPLVYYSLIDQLPQTQKLSPTLQNYTVTADLIKLYIRLYSEDELLVRLHNLREDQAVTVQEFYNKEEGTCRLLQDELLGRQGPIIKVKEVKEVTLTTIQQKSEMLRKKYK